MKQFRMFSPSIRCFAALSFLPAVLLAQSPLAITTSSLPVGSVGQSYAAQLVATGGVLPYTWSASGQLPPGLAALSSGVIAGTPTSGGVYAFSVSVRDNAGAVASRQLSITIGGTGAQLKITTTSLPSGTVGQAYSQQLAASGGAPPYQWGPAQGLQPGLQLSSSGVISGTPTAAGSSSLTIQVTDSAKTSTTGQIQLVVQPATLTITTVPPLFTGTVGTSYAQPFSASGGQTPYTWSITSGNTDGLTMDPVSGNLAGTPQAAGTFSFTVQVKDSLGTAATGSFSIVVNPPSLTITVGSALPAGAVGVSYSQKLPVQANGGTPPYTWSLSNPPAGLSFDPTTLLLSGTPTTAGTFSFTIQVADSTLLTATKTLSLTIAPQGLNITGSRQLPDGLLNAAYSQQLTATGGQPPYRWSANGLPTGLSINPSTGQITGTPTAAGSFAIAITVSDTTLANFSDRFTMNVALPTPPPVTFSGLPATVSPAQQYSLQVSIGAPYPAPITGQAILSFSPDTGPTDRTIQFASGGTTANFTIPTGSTTADTPLAIQTGTVSGTITVSLRLQAGGVDITPSPAPTVTSQIVRAAPVIRSTQVNRSGSTLNVVVTGYSTAREVTQAVFTFSAASGQTLQASASTVTIDVSNLFGNWFVDPANSQFGSVFVYTQPFTIQGDVNAVIPVSVTLTNRVGSVSANIGQ